MTCRRHHKKRKHLRRSRRRSITLLELVLNVSVAALLMGGLMSAVLLAARAVPDGRRPVDAVIEAADTLGQVADELHCALSFSQRWATGVEFTVTDRNADDAPETIRYEWSGTPGDPLTRQYNGGSVVTILDDVRQFDLAYDLTLASYEMPAGDTESDETLLVSNHATENLSGFAIDAANWPGQYFRPGLALGTVSWRVTRVRFNARFEGAADGRTTVQLRPATTDYLPEIAVLEEVPMEESDLSSEYLPQEFPFSNVSDLSPTEGLCLVLQHVSDTHSGNVQFQQQGATLPTAYFLQTANGGFSWSKDSDKALLFDVYGTVTTFSEASVVDVYYLTGVHLEVRAGDNPSTAVETFIAVINRPEVTGP